MIPDQSHLDHADKPSDHAERRDALSRTIGPTAIAVIAATPERNRNNDVDYPYRPNSDFRYLTGFGEPLSIAVLAPGREEGEYVLFCRERDPAAETWIGHRAGTEGAMARFGADQAFPIEEFDARIGDMLSNRECLYMTQGIHPEFEQRLLTCLNDLRSRGRHAAPPEQIISINSVVHEMRLRKSDNELALMRQAAATSAAGHRAAMKAAAPGVYEYQLEATLHYVYGLDGMSWAYPTIVGAGANACVLHYVENAAPLADGDLVLIDSGAEYRGYAGDITRTFPANGRFTDTQREIYDIVLAANEAAIAVCRAGEKANAPHQIALNTLVDGLLELGFVSGDRDSVIEDESYKTFFMHGTSHWLGMDVHDVGLYKKHGEWRDLEPGMVLTIEPGLYIPPGTEGVDSRYWGIGIRVEDDVVITDGEPEVLTADVPKAPVDIETLMDERA
ncbi:aminopeptidase P N-terminal domain-containing protein [Salinisphaera hydrothermalis]|uniref:aminopeptidase P N-terminal domain-containing protein n=1 Tax=Salinisphaera hydrothermalis TaxID=563188 RepID=UPI003342A7EE